MRGCDIVSNSIRLLLRGKVTEGFLSDLSSGAIEFTEDWSGGWVLGLSYLIKAHVDEQIR